MTLFSLQKVKEKYLVIFLNLIALIDSLISSYKSNGHYFTENVFTITFLIYLTIMILLILLIKNKKYLLSISILLFLNIPFLLKSNIQNAVINLNFTPNLLQNHIITFLILVIALLIIYLAVIKSRIFLLYFLLFFYSLALVKSIMSNNIIVKNSLKINSHIKSISKNYYFLLFDEYPNENIIIKYTKIEKKDLLSYALKNNGFVNVQNIFSNFTNTQNSTTSLLTGVIDNGYSINQTINALQNNVFSNQRDYQFNHVSIFDENNRKNSLVSIQFFKGNYSLLNRYIIPYILHYFSKRGVGIFTDYEDYHNQALGKLNLITLSKIKNVTYIHFYTPHNYPLVENIKLEDRLRNANQWINKSIKIVEKNDPTAGIVIFSDHGLRLNKIPKTEWAKNILFYKNIKLDTTALNKSGLSTLFKSITF